MVKCQSPDPPFILHYPANQGEMGLFITFSVYELHRGYLYQIWSEFRHKAIGTGFGVIFAISQGGIRNALLSYIVRFG